MPKPYIVTYDTEISHPGVQRLLTSLRKWKWDFTILRDPQWLGFGRKFKRTVAHCKELAERTDYTHVISIDARDFIAVGPPEEFTAPIVPLLISTEKGCWPDSHLASEYPKCDTPWKYAHSPFTIDLTRLELLHPEWLQDWEDDQRHVTKLFFGIEERFVALDYRGDVVQSVAFCLPNWQDSFEINGDRISNKLTGSKPLLLHANGGTETEWWKPLL